MCKYIANSIQHFSTLLRHHCCWCLHTGRAIFTAQRMSPGLALDPAAASRPAHDFCCHACALTQCHWFAPLLPICSPCCSLRYRMASLRHLLPSAPGDEAGPGDLIDTEFLALATLILQCSSLSEGPFRAVRPDDFQIWSRAHEALVGLLRTCCDEVGGSCCRSVLPGCLQVCSGCC
jgi:hypothetical protein